MTTRRALGITALGEVGRCKKATWAQALSPAWHQEIEGEADLCTKPDAVGADVNIANQAVEERREKYKSRYRGLRHDSSTRSASSRIEARASLR
jgi:hypothetical protein